MEEKSTVYYPQDEMHTFLLPVTVGCSWNKCTFCSMYKGVEYAEISLPQIENHLRNADKYTERVFLTGADPVAIGFKKMKQLLDLIHKYLPHCGCVASYASILNLSKYSVEELMVLHNAGLRDLYIGFETGRDDVLQFMKKCQTVTHAIREAKKLNAAHIPFNTIIMYGIAGKGEGVDNALKTAEMINQFTTKRIITMNLTIMQGTELSRMEETGEFVAASGKERILELKTLLENLEPKQSMIFDTTHPTNIIKIKGTLPDDRRRLLTELAKQID